MVTRDDVGMAENADKKAEKSYGLRELAKDFPQVFRANRTVKRSTLKKKYTLRDAMVITQEFSKKLQQAAALDYDICIMIFSRGGMVQITGEAAQYLRDYWSDVVIDLIEAGWNFQSC